MTRPEQPLQRRIHIPMMQAGIHVNEDTAMQFGAVYRAIDYISSQLSMMPWRVYMQAGDYTNLQNTHPVDRLLYVRPNPEMTPFVFKQTLIAHALSWGNGYAEIMHDNAGRPYELWPISPDRVQPKRDENERLVYEISNSREGKTYLPAEKIYHLHGLGYDGITGYSVISHMARSIGVGMAAEQFGASFFQNGTVQGLTLTSPEMLSDTARDNLQKSIENSYKGPGNAFRLMILEEGLKADNMTIPPEDAQYLETRQFSVNEIARWYGLPPHILGDLSKSSFNNIEEENISVVNRALMPWATRLEQEANFKLFPMRQQGRLYSRIDLKSLMRGSLKDRTEYYRTMFDMGAFSPNKILDLEDMNPIPDGEKHLVQMNLQTLEKAGEEVEAPEPSPMIEGQEDEMENEAVQAIASKIVRRENFRMCDAALRYDERDDYLAWMDNFMREHINYATNAFLNNGIEASDIIVSRVPEIRLKMLDYFDFNEAFNVDELTDILTNSVLRQSRGKAHAYN